MKHLRLTARAVGLAAVVLVGVGACALDPQGDGSGAVAPVPVGVTEAASGASAPSTPDQPAEPAQTSRTTTPTPNDTGTTAATTTLTASGASCPQGEHQRAVEQYLNKLGGFGKLTVDGKQSAADCAAIKKFQRRYGISPAAGRAGPTTRDVARRLAATDVRRCRAGSALTFCVDLTRQTVWAMRGGKVVMPPTVTRTGMAGYATPTGTYRVGWKNKKEWSNPYKVWLPYWQQFNGGIGFHETTTYLHNKPIGSHGCVNLLHQDAVQLWKLGKVGTRVVVFGHRAGT
ncbi:Putative peptidoglycan binding domain-containing protein [Micromonospora viridifaciens]|uniref:Putative peptidoglycan binding domain-containing protein n=1 Tax=Micromonospora viridifaciens TaxID=1881 RepID=A0A1C5A156_MICVI|nr:L,D-transpeptidase family protein [Micromonospora viridifaciens]SCF38913.1 Putative peptidoglycan binding domain-containing protein [Micromonospora viridifaciens]